MDELKEIMADCKKNGIKVLLPDVNESDSQFSVNASGDIRYGLNGMKGFGANIADKIISEREENGLYKNIFDFMERLGGIISRKPLEILIYSGSLDSFGIKRTQYFTPCANDELFIDELVKYSILYKNDTIDSSTSLFGDVEELKPVRPEVPSFKEEEDILSLLQEEKAYVGMYLSSHPLEKYRFEIENFTTNSLAQLPEVLDKCQTSDTKANIKVAGIVSDVRTKTTKSGTPGLSVMLEDFSGNYNFVFFGNDYQNYINYLTLHSQIMIEAEIAPRYIIKEEERKQGKTAPYGIRYKKMSLLGTLCENNIDGFEILIDSEILNSDFRKRLLSTLSKYKGKTSLYIHLIDKATGYKIDFISKKHYVEISSDFIADIEAMGLNYKVIKK